MIRLLREGSIHIIDLEISHSSDTDRDTRSAIFTLQMGKKGDSGKLLARASTLEGILAVEEL
jgi:hypothetical protein